MAVETRAQSSRSASRADSPVKDEKEEKVKEAKEAKPKEAKAKKDVEAAKDKKKKSKADLPKEGEEDADEDGVTRDYVRGMMKTVIEGLTQQSQQREKKLMQMVEDLSTKIELTQAAPIIDVDDVDDEDEDEWEDLRAKDGQHKRPRMEQTDPMASFTTVMERIAEKLDAQKKPKMDPFEEQIVEMNHGVAFPERIEFLSWNDPRVTLDPRMWVMILFRKAEKKTLEPQDFVYAEDST
mgnify:CR=1 FL=1